MSMQNQDYRMYALKSMQMRIINLKNGRLWKDVGANGTIMKGRGKGDSKLSHDNKRILESEEIFFFADLYSADIRRRITVVYNPTLNSSGEEISVHSKAQYPAEQEFRLYVVVQFELPWIARIQYGRKVPRSFAMANRLENPIRVKTTLNKEWGLEPGLEYVLQDDQIPMWPWDWSQMDFYDNNPVTGGPPIPAAYVLSEGDSTKMIRAWRLEGESWIRRDN